MGDEPVRPYDADDCADEGHPRDDGNPPGAIDAEQDVAAEHPLEHPWPVE